MSNAFSADLGPFTCVFCQREWWAGTAGGLVVHAMPMCAEFQRMDVLDFVTANRKRVVGGEWGES
jgi:hypothetical protein